MGKPTGRNERECMSQEFRSSGLDMTPISHKLSKVRTDPKISSRAYFSSRRPLINYGTGTVWINLSSTCSCNGAFVSAGIFFGSTFIGRDAGARRLSSRCDCARCSATISGGCGGQSPSCQSRFATKERTARFMRYILPGLLSTIFGFVSIRVLIHSDMMSAASSTS